MSNITTSGTTGYPSVLDTRTTLVDGSSGDEMVANHPNGLGAAVIAIETELGVLPKGSSADLATRLSAGPIVTSSVGPHAIGGAISTDTSLRTLGALTGVINSNGLTVEHTLTVPANGQGFALNVVPIINKAGAGTHTDFVSAYFQPPTIGAGAAGLLNSSTVKITASPTVGNASYSLWVQQGLTYLDAFQTTAPNTGTAAQWRVGTVSVTTPTNQNRTIQVEVNGSLYYVSARTVNG